MKRVYQHRINPHTNAKDARSLVVEIDSDHVRITCDAPGIAAVSHTLTWQEWDELVTEVDVNL